MSRQVDFPAGERADCEVTVLIKAYNEEAKIKDCLDSVMSSIHGLSAEVVLIDSLSIDRTVEIAMPYPISIVQFVRREDCGAAAAVELGYRVSRGRYIYVLDGDMELEPGFLLHALDWLKRNPSYAGVAGILSDTTVRNFEDRRRQASRDSQGGRNHDHLGSGGLYRREVIRQLGDCPGLASDTQGTTRARSV
jgi:glycosyltransferase involved in cell wall biosynthesis